MTDQAISATATADVAKAKLSAEQTIMYDVVFVLNVNSRGWILEKICAVIAEGLGLHTRLVFTERNDSITGWLPRSRAYFFSHFKLFMSAIDKEPDVARAKTYIWFTHPSFDRSNLIENFVAAMRRATMIFTANTFHERTLEFLGIDPHRVKTVLGGADPAQFKPHPRTGRTVGIVGAYYERKNPELMLEVVRAMPDTRFLLVGPDESEVENNGLLWENWSRFDELAACDNLEYVSARYEAFADYYAQMDVYLSLSKLEGGPIPLIEAMFVNCVPVVTRTGFAEDIVRHGTNGYLLATEPTLTEVTDAIAAALKDTTTDIAASAAHLSWSSYAARFRDLIDPVVAIDEIVTFATQATRADHLREGWAFDPLKGAELAMRAGRVRVRVAPTAATLALAIFVRTAPGRQGLSVRVRANGQVIDEARFGYGSHLREIALPAAVAASGVLDLMIEYADTLLSQYAVIRIDSITLLDRPAVQLPPDRMDILRSQALDSDDVNRLNRGPLWVDDVVLIRSPSGNGRRPDELLSLIESQIGAPVELFGEGPIGAPLDAEPGALIVLDGPDLDQATTTPADVVICQSPAEKARLAPKFPTTVVSYIPNPVTEAAMAKPKSGTDPVNYALWFGRVADGDFASIVWVLEQLRERGVTVEIVPLDDADIADQWRPHVVGVGAAALDAALARADVCIVGDAGDSLVRMTASTAAGVPVIVHQSPELRKILTVADLNFAFVNSPQRLTRAVSDFDDPNRRQLYVRKLQAVLLKEFGSENAIRAFRDLILGAAAKRDMSERKLRVAFVAHNLSMGEGAPRSLFEMVRGLQEAGLQPLLYSVGAGELLEDYIAHGIEATIFDPAATNMIKVLNKAVAPVRDHFTAFLDRENVDIVICNAANTAAFVSFAEDAGVPGVLVVRESATMEDRLAAFSPELAALARVGVERARTVIFVSDATRELWTLDTKLARTAVITNGVDPRRFDEAMAMTKAEARARLGIEENAVIALAVGTVNARKGQLEVATAFSKLDAALRNQAGLIIVGLAQNRYREEFLAGFEALPDEARTRITVVDEVRDPGIYYRAADFFLLNSENESFPRSVMEAFLFGLPVLSTNVFGLEEQVAHRYNGFTYAPGDMDAWSRNFRTLIRDTALRATMAQAATDSFWNFPSHPEMISAYARELMAAISAAKGSTAEAIQDAA